MSDGREPTSFRQSLRFMATTVASSMSTAFCMWLGFLNGGSFATIARYKLLLWLAHCSATDPFVSRYFPKTRQAFAVRRFNADTVMLAGDGGEAIRRLFTRVRSMLLRSVWPRSMYVSQNEDMR